MVYRVTSRSLLPSGEGNLDLDAEYGVYGGLELFLVFCQGLKRVRG